MQNHLVYVKYANQAVEIVTVAAFGENDAVAKVAKMNLPGTIFAVRSAHSTLPV